MDFPRMKDDEIIVGKMYKIVTSDGLITVRVTEKKYVKDWRKNFETKVWAYMGVNLQTGKQRAFRAKAVRREIGFAPKPKKSIFGGFRRMLNV